MDLYEALGAQYDEMISWESRYGREGPFFRALFEKEKVESVVDAASGTGMHARWFAGWGLNVVAADPSPAMMATAAHNTSGLPVRLLQAGFGELRASLDGQFDAVTCLGNSLPHLLTDDALAAALADFRALLRQGGILVLHNNNYDAILDHRDRFMPLAARHTPDGHKLFVRFFDFPHEPGPLAFNVVVLSQEPNGWTMEVNSTKHRPVRRRDVEALLIGAGFSAPEMYGSFAGDPFDEDRSDNLIAVAHAA
jgi:glycine/sarcosine N-methyltransferase